MAITKNDLGVQMTNGEKIQTILDIDKDCTEVYGKNGMMTFSVPQDWWNAKYEEPTTKNDLGVDCISRQAVLDIVDSYSESQSNVEDVTQDIISDIMVLPSVASQEPFKPMVEIDLYSVIKQKYIEREVLDKIRAQIKSNLRGVEIALEVLAENHPLRPKMEGAKDTLEECLEIIDKYKAETEAE